MGAGIALDHLDLIKRSVPAEGEWLVSFSSYLSADPLAVSSTSAESARL